uniref:Uncharacterized protein n=1 Tax=Amphimedon queenslandica TaxID=400682 RepID=A0A1X7VJS6_AMPQE
MSVTLHIFVLQMHVKSYHMLLRIFSKRLALKQSQHFTSTEPHKILKPAQTRCLSLHQCVVRVLEQWSALGAYFKQAAQKERLIATQNVLSALKNPIFKLYYQFLSFVLPKFTTFNKLF